MRVPVDRYGKTKVFAATCVEYHFVDDAPYPLDNIKRVIGKTEEMDEE